MFLLERKLRRPFLHPIQVHEENDYFLGDLARLSSPSMVVIGDLGTSYPVKRRPPVLLPSVGATVQCTPPFHALVSLSHYVAQHPHVVAEGLDTAVLPCSVDVAAFHPNASVRAAARSQPLQPPQSSESGAATASASEAPQRLHRGIDDADSDWDSGNAVSRWCPQWGTAEQRRWRRGHGGAGGRVIILSESSESESESEVVVFGFLSRWAPMKGLGLLLEAIPAVLARAPNARFLIAGGNIVDPHVEASVRAVMASYNFSSKVSASAVTTRGCAVSD